MTALQYFRMFASEFASIDDVTVQAWLDIAVLRFHAECLTQELLNQATAYAAAHLIKMGLLSSSGGVSSGLIVREKEGDLEREYAKPLAISGSSGGWNSTPYGMQFMDLIKPCFGSGIMTRMDLNGLGY